MSPDVLAEIKLNIREAQYPYFKDDEIEMIYNQCGGDIKDTCYRCLITKSEDTTLVISGLTLADTSKYFRRIASKYRRSNSGTLKEW